MSDMSAVSYVICWAARRAQITSSIELSLPVPHQRPSGPKGPLDSACAHAGDGRTYLAQGSSMQYDRRNQTQCACETIR